MSSYPVVAVGKVVLAEVRVTQVIGGEVEEGRAACGSFKLKWQGTKEKEADENM